MWTKNGLKNDLLGRVPHLWLFCMSIYILIAVSWMLQHGTIVNHYVFTVFSTPIQKFRYLTRLFIYLLFAVCQCMNSKKMTVTSEHSPSFPLSVLSWWRNSPPFMEFKSSLPCSQGLATIFCIKQDDSSPCIDTFLTSFRSVLILSSHLYIAVHRGIFPSGFLTEILYPVFFCLYCMPHPSCPLFHHHNIFSLCTLCQSFWQIW